jgi:hypothetical protein
LTNIPSIFIEKIGVQPIKKFQIIQHQIDEIELLIDIDNYWKNKKIELNKIKKILLFEFKRKLGENVNIIINDNKSHFIENSKYNKLVISKLKKI